MPGFAGETGNTGATGATGRSYGPQGGPGPTYSQPPCEGPVGEYMQLNICLYVYVKISYQP